LAIKYWLPWLSAFLITFVISTWWRATVATSSSSFYLLLHVRVAKSSLSECARRSMTGKAERYRFQCFDWRRQLSGTWPRSGICHRVGRQGHVPQQDGKRTGRHPACRKGGCPCLNELSAHSAIVVASVTLGGFPTISCELIYDRSGQCAHDLRKNRW